MRLNLDSEIGLARFGVETKHETKPNLPNSADRATDLSSATAGLSQNPEHQHANFC